MAKIKMPKLEASTFRGWTFVLVAGVVLTVLAMIDRGGLTGLATGRTGCVMTVTATEVNIRSAPGTELAPVGVLREGDQVDAERVVTNGFRQLAGEDRWVYDASLTPTTGSRC
ncbi:hypothetical protein [Pseudonocardia asaccharolytica]|uniref:SH3b domain-containing protein n=1 Tax=Pseudonocardia asaccharolytica DSM 44247 = NBRC 16224 TaxID=1123024 RepID=A0A511D006_9PSEU|nr:hypothetical protein [Pseudonocardia asaccharolytica]GEL16188.1 hypothetical protein PA7_00250 [Pseudonocardia asaccharolytica DSM 44247 = NBRC 16224]